MRILLHYLKPYKWLVAFALFLAAVNQIFSLFAPMISGNLLDMFANHPITLTRLKHYHALSAITFGAEVAITGCSFTFFIGGHRNG
ncbi:hypothetical protein [Niabella hibiscisoli]|uniref:hypothetical protein n=1 Tax=Niabella hibiscisoli TaxID=1825928 RepID=UPI001F0E4155|nr:hypothetical protein [Niabella hibiscisoli]MCH5717604.1 hypothetical protein [Niabella hibiscisoli]